MTTSLSMVVTSSFPLHSVPPFLNVSMRPIRASPDQRTELGYPSTGPGLIKPSSHTLQIVSSARTLSHLTLANRSSPSHVLHAHSNRWPWISLTMQVKTFWWWLTASLTGPISALWARTPLLPAPSMSYVAFSAALQLRTLSGPMVARSSPLAIFSPS